MGLRIKTNVESLVAQRHLADNQREMQDSLEKLSSGQRINKSADDAAGLAISERIRATTRSLDVSKRNASDGISYLQVAEGGLNEVTNIIIRMRELTSQAASDTLGDRERGFLDKEFQQLRQEVHRIVQGTEFNGTKVLTTDNEKPIDIFVGATNRGNDADGNAPQIDKDNDPDVLRIDLKDLGALQEALDGLATNDSENRDYSLVPESGGGAQDLGPTGTSELFNKIDSSLNAIASYRATLGAVQSRLNSTITNDEVASENLQAAQSRIRDVDFAAETARLTQARILSQAGLSVASQANSTPEMVMQLLRS